MAIQIGGTTVISDDFNIENVNDMRVGLVTFFGSSGNIQTPGTVSVGGLDFPVEVFSFSPADGATGVEPDANIVITFNQFVQKPTTGIGTTANITLRNSSGIGTVLQTIGINSTSVAINGPVVTISHQLIYEKNIYVVIDSSAFNSSGGNSSLIDTYNFTTKSPNLGNSYEGGFLICCASPTRWIVSPSSAQVSRCWTLRGDANTRSQQVSGCTGWFVPTNVQLQNPGYTCRTYWDSFSSAVYWSSSVNVYAPSNSSQFTDFTNGAVGCAGQPGVCCVRSFRCVTY